jgi:hypothetical protein
LDRKSRESADVQKLIEVRFAEDCPRASKDFRNMTDFDGYLKFDQNGEGELL